ncbi:DUF6415 family natural product biosynthesis protein [Streptomyces caelestis]|uniref:DUF6415 family natural product biosynthesis protein n=1 Tax=Streptomyces caelestis TaxID=36816 RepID=UPI00344C940B
MQHLITEALSATGTLPRPTRLAELDGQLRTEILRLIPAVQKRADDAEHRSPEWYALDRVLDRAHDMLRVRLPSTPLAGSIHVGELARRLYALQQSEGGQQ